MEAAIGEAQNCFAFHLLPFGEFLETGVRTTHARLKSFDPSELVKSSAIQTVTRGILDNEDFLLEEEERFEPRSRKER